MLVRIDSIAEQNNTLIPSVTTAEPMVIPIATKTLVEFSDVASSSTSFTIRRAVVSI